MTFFEEVRKIFKTYDPGRLYLSKRIAKKYSNRSKQKAVIQHLLAIYQNGGVEAIDLSQREVKKIQPAPEVIEEVVETEEISEVTNDFEEITDDENTKEEN